MTSAQSTALLTVEGLTCRIGGVCAVDDVDLSVAEGSITGVVGPNGAGKTTLFNAMTGFVTYQSGDVRWSGQSVRGWRPHRVANAGLARTFQNAAGFGRLTVRQNITLAARRRGGPDVDEICSILLLEGELDRRLSACSLATRKLVGIAMAAVRRPRMILLDEPLSGLDLMERDAVVETVRLLRDRGVTVLLIEHDIDRTLSLVDELTILDVGRKIAHGSPTDLAGDPALRDVYLKM
ncbi:ABC transporter ATP-binding protein [Actinophytocola sp.]|uniref:ABC transporter ATP-binding protein n=1 Tax=Actinophytocola sp. TaxID=1872138 RepID=UPI003D6B4C30